MIKKIIGRYVSQYSHKKHIIYYAKLYLYIIIQSFCAVNDNMLMI